MREELGSQLDIDNVHMESIITKVREKRKMRTNLTHFPIDDEIGKITGHSSFLTGKYVRVPGDEYGFFVQCECD